METTIIVQNLKCNGCANTITNKISEIQGITNVVVNVDESSVSFSYTNIEELEAAKKALRANGYPEEGDANSLTTKAKSFVSCAVGKLNN